MTEDTAILLPAVAEASEPPPSASYASGTWAEPPLPLPSGVTPTGAMRRLLSQQMNEWDPRTLALTKAAHGLLEAVTGHVEAHEASQAGGRRRARGKAQPEFVRSLTALTGSVLRRWGGTSPGFAKVRTAKEAVKETGHMFRQFEGALEGLVASALCHRQPGIRYGRDSGGLAARQHFMGAASRLWPAPALLRLAEEHGISPANVKQHFGVRLAGVVPKAPAEDGPLLRLRGVAERHGAIPETLPYDPQEPAFAAILAGIERHNERAAVTPITGCSVVPRWRRTFVLNTDLGGRWSALGGVLGYQSANEATRLQMTIDGEAVAEVDLSSSHLTLLHHLFGLPRPAGDLYDIPGVSRDAAKAFTVITLGNGAPPAKRWPPKTLSDSPALAQEDYGTVREAICARYPFLAEPWRAVASLSDLAEPKRLLLSKLNGMEARIITDAVEAVWTAGEAQGRRWLALPMHDGLVVPESAVAATVEAFRAAAPCEVRLKVSWTDGRVEVVEGERAGG